MSLAWSIIVTAFWLSVFVTVIAIVFAAVSGAVAGVRALLNGPKRRRAAEAEAQADRQMRRERYEALRRDHPEYFTAEWIARNGRISEPPP